jgi:ParB-like chromosome segregation protein Spo0J
VFTSTPSTADSQSAVTASATDYAALSTNVATVQGDYEPHPAASIFPVIGEEDYNALKEDIRAHGQIEDIVLLGGKVLDGRNRLRACRELGLEPRWCELTECDDPIAYVLSKNLRRRHLMQSQRAACAAEVAKLRLGDNQHKKSEGSQICLPIDDAAKVFNVSASSVKTAKHVADKGDKAVVDAVKSGKITVSAAAKLVDAVPDKKKQRSIIKGGKKAVTQATKAKAEPEPPLLRPSGDVGEDQPPEKLSWALQAAVRATIRQFTASNSGTSNNLVVVVLEALVEQFRKLSDMDVEDTEEPSSPDVEPATATAPVSTSTVRTATASTSAASSAASAPLRTVTLGDFTYEIIKLAGTWHFRLPPEKAWTNCSEGMVEFIERENGSNE